MIDPYELEALVGEATLPRLGLGRRSFAIKSNATRVGQEWARSEQRSISRAALSELAPGASGKMLRILRKHRIKDFEANGRINGFEVDFLWRDEMFCVELDGWDGHKSRQAFERDRLKWAKLEASGVSGDANHRPPDQKRRSGSSSAGFKAQGQIERARPSQSNRSET